MNPVPVLVLVGFLGSGKTTLINHLLHHNHGKKIAVVVNEFGEINLDARMVRHTTEKMIELSNGCICCTLREDLLQELRSLAQLELDYIFIESTGIGEPLPIAQTFHMEDLPELVRLDAIVTVVDAASFWETWKSEGIGEDAEGNPVKQPLAPLLADQLEFTSVILINKTDLASPDELIHLESFLHEINPYARFCRTVRGQIEPDQLLGVGLYDYSEGTAHPDWETEWNQASSEVDEYGFESFFFHSDQPFTSEAFDAFIRQWPAGVIRAKGFVKFVNHVPFTLAQAGRQLVLEPQMEPLTQAQLEGLPQQEQADYLRLLEELSREPTELVFIGQGILKNEHLIRARLEACLA
jgi:G3E family GTPase